jgi:hypothetical protein
MRRKPEFTRVWFLFFHVVISLQIVVQCVASVGAEQFDRLDITKKELVWLSAGRMTPVSRLGILGAFSGLSPENRDGWLPYLQ